MVKQYLGFIEFEDKYDAEDAVKDLDDKKLCGERVKLEMSKVILYWSRININSKFLFRFQFREKIESNFI